MNPKYLPSSEKLNPTQRKSIGAGAYTPRERQESEALPISFVESQLTSIPKMEPSRKGASDHLKIKRIGFFC